MPRHSYVLNHKLYMPLLQRAEIMATPVACRQIGSKSVRNL